MIRAVFYNAAIDDHIRFLDSPKDILDVLPILCSLTWPEPSPSDCVWLVPEPGEG